MKADIGRAELRAVVDTGSGVNLMSKEIADKYSVQTQKYGVIVYHAEGKQIRLLGKKKPCQFAWEANLCAMQTFW